MLLIFLAAAKRQVVKPFVNISEIKRKLKRKHEKTWYHCGKMLQNLTIRKKLHGVLDSRPIGRRIDQYLEARHSQSSLCCVCRKWDGSFREWDDHASYIDWQDPVFSHFLLYLLRGKSPWSVPLLLWLILPV